MDIKINDCTIRDGGHLNKWHFDNNFVKASYFAASKAQVDYFEIGYKNDERKQGLGPYGYCKEDFISSLFKCSTHCKLLCMIDAGKYTGYHVPDCDKNKTPFSGIRIAAYPHEVDIAIKLIEKIYAKGYEVFLQIMASSEWAESQFNVLENWDNKYMLNAVYFADSFGSYVPADITAYVKKLKKLGFKSIGYHAHNSLQMAFANALKAMEEGVTYIDASIYGMGRGAGNLPMEILLSYLGKHGEKKYSVVPYLDVIDRFSLKLIEKYKWGYSLATLFGGIRNIHPYYVTELFKYHTYTIEEIWDIISSIKEKCPISFSDEKLKKVLGERFYIPTTEQAAEIVKKIESQIKIFPSEDAFSLSELKIRDRHKNKKFLIIANGPSIVKYEKKIKELIAKEGLLTIGCNFLKNIYEPTYHLFVSKKRFLKYVSSVSKNSTLIVPTFFGRRLVEENYNGKCEYIEITPANDLNSKPIDGTAQRSVYLNVAVAAILTAYQMGAQEIMAVGVDGYEQDGSKEPIYFYNEDDVPDDKMTASFRYESLVNEIKRASGYLQGEGIPFFIITPTSHKGYYKNIFGLEVNVNEK